MLGCLTPIAHDIIIRFCFIIKTEIKTKGYEVIGGGKLPNYTTSQVQIFGFESWLPPNNLGL